MYPERRRAGSRPGPRLILCCSHALSCLSAAGISPDFVLTTDSQDLRYHLDGCDLRTVTALLNATTVHPDLMELATDRTAALETARAMLGASFDEADAHEDASHFLAALAATRGSVRMIARLSAGPAHHPPPTWGLDTAAFR